MALCTAFGFCDALAEAADVLKYVPDHALAVVAINNIGQTDGKIEKLADQLQLPPLGVLGKAMADMGIENGINDRGCLAMAVILR